MIVKKYLEGKSVLKNVIVGGSVLLLAPLLGSYIPEAISSIGWGMLTVGTFLAGGAVAMIAEYLTEEYMM